MHGWCKLSLSDVTAWLSLYTGFDHRNSRRVPHEILAFLKHFIPPSRREWGSCSSSSVVKRRCCVWNYCGGCVPDPVLINPKIAFAPNSILSRFSYDGNTKCVIHYCIGNYTDGTNSNTHTQSELNRTFMFHLICVHICSNLWNY